MEIHAAKIAAAAALIGALFGAVGAGVPVFVIGKDQIPAADKRSSQEFLRSRREVAYSAFLEEADKLTDLYVRRDRLWSDFIVPVEESTTGRGTGVGPGVRLTAEGTAANVQIESELKKNWPTFFAAYTRLQLLASEDVQVTALKLYEVHQRAYPYSSGLSLPRDQISDASMDASPSGPHIDELQGAVRKNFVVAAQEDLTAV